MINEKLYPPQIAGTLPAFYKNYSPDTGLCMKTELKIPFTMNQAVSESQIDGFVLKIKTVQTGTYIFAPQYSTIFNLAEGTVTFMIEEDLVKLLNEGQYYKIQLAYFAHPVFEAVDENGTTILAKDYFSKNIGYYSTVGVIKCISKPSIFIKGFQSDSINLFQNEIYGVYSLEEALDKTEKVYSYNFKFYDEQNEIYWDSGELIHNCSMDSEYGLSNDILVLNNFFSNGKTYGLQYTITTRNGYVGSSPLYKIISDDLLPPTKDLYITAQENYSDGYIRINFQGILEERIFNEGMPNEEKRMVEQPYFGEYLLSRASEESNFTEWLELKRFRLENSAPSHVSFNDFSVKQGVKYLYSVQQYNMWGLYSNRILSDYVSVDFEDMYLYDGQRCLKIRFNPKISSFKTNILEQKIDTIGNKYPFIFRNGNVSYKEFPISGLISYQMDDTLLFYDREIHEFIRETSNSGDTQIDENDVKQILNIDPSALNEYKVHTERDFKLEVLDWLNNGQPKLFKSGTEGNYIVRLMNVNLQPVDALGRILHSFTCNAYEIAEFNYKNLIKYKFVEADEVSDYVSLWRSYNLNDYEFGKDIEIIFDKEVSSFVVQDMFPGQNLYLYYLDAPDYEYEVITIGVTGSYRFENSNRSVYKIIIPNIQQKATGVIECQYKGLRYSEFDGIKNISLKTILSNQYIGINPQLLKIEEQINNNNFDSSSPSLNQDLFLLDSRILSNSFNQNSDILKELKELNFMAGDIVQQINSSIFNFTKPKIKIINLEQLHLRTRRVCPIYTAPYEYIDYNFWDDKPDYIIFGTNVEKNRFYKTCIEIKDLNEKEFNKGIYYTKDQLNEEIIISVDYPNLSQSSLITIQSPIDKNIYAKVFNSNETYYKYMYRQEDYNSEFWPIDQKFYFISLLQEPYPFDELMPRMKDHYDMNDPYPMFLLLEYHNETDEWLPRQNHNDVFTGGILNEDGCYYDPYWKSLLLENQYDTKYVINEPLYIYEPINKLTTQDLNQYLNLETKQVIFDIPNGTNYIKIENVLKHSAVRIIYKDNKDKMLSTNFFGSLEHQSNKLISKIIIYDQINLDKSIISYNYCNISIEDLNNLFIKNDNDFISLTSLYLDPITKEYKEEMYNLINSFDNSLFLRQLNGSDLLEQQEVHYNNLGEVKSVKIGTGLIAEATFQLQILDYFTEEHDLETAAAKKDYLDKAEFLRNIYRAYEILAEADDKYQKYLSLYRFYNTIINGDKNITINSSNENNYNSDPNLTINYHDRVVMNNLLEANQDIYQSDLIDDRIKQNVEKKVLALKVNKIFQDSLALEEDEKAQLLHLIEYNNIESLNEKLTSITNVQNSAETSIQTIENTVETERNKFAELTSSLQKELNEYKEVVLDYKNDLWILELLRRYENAQTPLKPNETYLQKIYQYYLDLYSANEFTIDNASPQITDYKEKYEKLYAEASQSLQNIAIYSQIIKDKNEDEVLDKYLNSQINQELQIILQRLNQLNILKENLNFIITKGNRQGDFYLKEIAGETFVENTYSLNFIQKNNQWQAEIPNIENIDENSEINITSVPNSYLIEDFSGKVNKNSLIIISSKEIIGQIDISIKYSTNDYLKSNYRIENLKAKINNYLFLFNDQSVNFQKSIIDLFIKTNNYYIMMQNFKDSDFTKEIIFNYINLVDSLEYMNNGYQLLTTEYLKAELINNSIISEEEKSIVKQLETYIEYRDDIIIKEHLSKLDESEVRIFNDQRLYIHSLTQNSNYIPNGIHNNKLYDGYENESIEEKSYRFNTVIRKLNIRLKELVEDQVSKNETQEEDTTKNRILDDDALNNKLIKALGYGYCNEETNLFNEINEFNTSIKSYYLELKTNIDKAKFLSLMADFNNLHQLNSNGVNAFESFGVGWEEKYVSQECPILDQLELPEYNGLKIEIQNIEDTISVNTDFSSQLDSNLINIAENLNNEIFSTNMSIDNDLAIFILNFNIVNLYNPFIQQNKKSIPAGYEINAKYAILSLITLSKYKNSANEPAKTGIFEWYISQVLENTKQYYEDLYLQSGMLVEYYQKLNKAYNEKLTKYLESFTQYSEIYASYIGTAVFTYYQSAIEDKDKTLNELIESVKNAWSEFVLILDKAYTKEYNGGMYR